MLIINLFEFSDICNEIQTNDRANRFTTLHFWYIVFGGAEPSLSLSLTRFISHAVSRANTTDWADGYIKNDEFFFGFWREKKKLIKLTACTCTKESTTTTVVVAWFFTVARSVGREQHSPCLAIITLWPSVSLIENCRHINGRIL